MLDEPLKLVPVFVLVLFRIAGLMLYAPLLGSAKIPKRVRALLALVLAIGLTPAVAMPPQLPGTALGTAVAIGGEMMFGLAMGMILSFVFIAAQWAGEVIGQQMGLTLSEVFDPQFAGASSVVGDLYFMLLLVIFLGVGGEREMVRGLRDSFQSLPLLAVGVNHSVFDIVMGMFSATTVLAVRLAAPLMVTLLVVDVTLGFLGKTMPQLNVMTTGSNVKILVGLGVVLLGFSLGHTSTVLTAAIGDSLRTVQQSWHGQ